MCVEGDGVFFFCFSFWFFFFFFQAEDGIRDGRVTGVQTCALPISLRLHLSAHHAKTDERFAIPGDKSRDNRVKGALVRRVTVQFAFAKIKQRATVRSDEHTSELQSPVHLVCCLLLEKKKNNHHTQS